MTLSCLFLILKNLFWYVNDDENTSIISSFLTIEKLITLLRKRQTQLSAIYIQTTVITSNRKNPGIHPAMRLIRFPRLVNAGMERPAGAADGGNPCRFVRSLFVWPLVCPSRHGFDPTQIQAKDRGRGEREGQVVCRWCDDVIAPYAAPSRGLNHIRAY